MTPMAFFTRCSAIALSALLSACAGSGAAPVRADIIAAELDADHRALELQLHLVASPVLAEALANGVPLVFEFRLRPANGAVRRQALRLQYLPLSGRYQLQQDGHPDQQFGSQLQLFAALDRVRLEFDQPLATSGWVSFALDRRALPAALRLPALLDRGWWVVSERVHWQARS